MNDGLLAFGVLFSFSGHYAWVLELDRYLLLIPPGAHCYVFCTCMALGDQFAFSFATDSIWHSHASLSAFPLSCITLLI